MELSIRITSEIASFEDIIAIIDPVTDRYIIALENATSRHFQCYVSYIGEDDLKYSKLRYRFKTNGYSGNAQLSITKMRNKNLMVYVLKDGDYRTKGFSPEEIATLAEQSYEKPQSYKAEKKQIDQQWMTSQSPSNDNFKYDWLESRIALCIKYDMGYDRYKLQKEFKTLWFARYPEEILTECKEFFEKL